MMGRGFDLLLLLRRMAGRGHDNRNAPFQANRQDGHRSIGQGEIDQNIDLAAQGDRRSHGRADRAQARDVANILAQPWMIAAFERRADAQFFVFMSELDNAQTHPAAGAADGYVCLHEYTSIALMISSRSFGTCTARLAKVARRTPRQPRTSSKVFWSVL